MHRTGCALVAALLLLAGCGGNAGDPAAEPTYETTHGTAASQPTGPSATASATATAAIDPDLASAAADLASAAEAQASSLPSGVAIEPRSGQVIGADISWPQCPPGMGIPDKISSGQPMPTEDAEYVIIGLTNGPGFFANPCLADQVAYAKAAGLLTAAYAVASYPDVNTLKSYGRQGPYDPETPDGALKNVGYAQAVFNVASMRNAGLASPIVWIDVEQVPNYEWSTSVSDNAAVVVGAAQGYLDAGLRIGVYSTPYLWEGVVGELALGVPEWRAAGQTSMAEALDRCGLEWSIQGGRAVLGQWVEESRDKNVTCPDIAADLGEWFAPALGG